MKKNYEIFLLLFLIGITNISYGQLQLSGELRPRPEYQNGYKTLRNEGDTANTFISQRTRIKFDYEMEYLKFKVTFQDVRTWGSTSQLNITDEYLELHEAWGEVMFNDEFSLKLGRQEVAYDDHRIFGSVLWAQQSRSHDMGILKYESDFKIHVGVAYNQYKNADLQDYKNFYKSLQFVWFHKDFSNLQMSVLALNNGLQVYDNTTSLLTKEVNYSQTLGAFLKGNISIVSLDGSFYYQLGKDRINRSISAYDFALNASVSINDAFVVKAGFEMLSGTDYDADVDKSNSFNPFYGTNHKFNGFMDYFYVGGGHIDNVGLNDLNVSGLFKYGKWNSAIKVHYFMSNAKQYDLVNSEVAASGLGTEIDLSLGYKFNDWISFSAGYSQMFATHSMEVLKGGNKDVINNFAYILVSLKPKFLDTSK